MPAPSKKPDKKLLAAVRAAFTSEASDELTRLWNVHAALADVGADARRAIADVVIADAAPSLARDWLATHAECCGRSSSMARSGRLDRGPGPRR